MNIESPKSRQKLPSNAELVFKGVIFSVYQWQQKMFDGSYQTFEAISRSDTVSVIPVIGDKIMISYQEQPSIGNFIGSLGGRIDGGEAPLQAAKRELLEETGYQAKDWRLWYAIQPATKIDWANYCFIARDCQKIADQNLDSGEKIITKLVSFEEFIKITADEKYRDSSTSLKIFQASQQDGGLEKLKQMLFE